MGSINWLMVYIDWLLVHANWLMGYGNRPTPCTFHPTRRSASVNVRRLDGNPIIAPALDDRLGENVNGPSLIRAPPWIDDPLGTYYLYFADHGGTSIRLAYADALSGEWTLADTDPLKLEEAGPGFDAHVASPDAHVDVAHERVWVYYHGCCDRFEDPAGRTDQYTRLALSEDGRNFEAREEALGRFYFRVFEYEDAFYALAKENRGSNQEKSGQRVYRSSDGLSGFERGPLLFRNGSRHTAVRVRADTLEVFYSRIGDAPERILRSTVDLSPDWMAWTATDPEPILEPERNWEGADEPVVPSTAGGVDEPVNQLRDPALYEEGDRTYLLYSVAGESGIAIAELLT